MKESDAVVDYNNHQLLLYVEKNNGTYEPMQTGSFLTKNYVDDFWGKQKKNQEDLLKKLFTGQISPIGYYMAMINISDADVAVRAGISIRKVRMHKQISFFDKINISLLKKYAAIFDIPLADMFQIRIQADINYSLIHEKTSNPFITSVKIVEEKK
jgi:hypothetical protein